MINTVICPIWEVEELIEQIKHNEIIDQEDIKEAHIRILELLDGIAERAGMDNEGESDDAEFYKQPEIKQLHKMVDNRYRWILDSRKNSDLQIAQDALECFIFDVNYILELGEHKNAERNYDICRHAALKIIDSMLRRNNVLYVLSRNGAPVWARSHIDLALGLSTWLYNSQAASELAIKKDTFYLRNCDDTCGNKYLTHNIKGL